jgi:FOG: CBS domain
MSQSIRISQSIRDVMTPNPCAISPNASVLDAAQIMRGNDIGDVIVLEDDRLFGILTDRDIVVRVLAEGGDPETTPVGEICSRDAHHHRAHGKRGRRGAPHAGEGHSPSPRGGRRGLRDGYRLDRRRGGGAGSPLGAGRYQRAPPND